MVRNGGMRVVFAAFAVLCLLAAPAGAKGKMTMSLGDASPAVGQKITVVLRMEHVISKPAPQVMVVAVAPGRDWFDVVGTVTRQSQLAHADIPRDGFRVDLTHVAGDRWRAYVSFPRPGRWQLVVPNWGGVPGIAIPPPIMRPISVGLAG
jgi:hypothetical protein